MICDTTLDFRGAVSTCLSWIRSRGARLPSTLDRLLHVFDTMASLYCCVARARRVINVLGYCFPANVEVVKAGVSVVTSGKRRIDASLTCIGDGCALTVDADPGLDIPEPGLGSCSSKLYARRSVLCMADGVEPAIAYSRFIGFIDAVIRRLGDGGVSAVTVMLDVQSPSVYIDATLYGYPAFEAGSIKAASTIGDVTVKLLARVRSGYARISAEGGTWELSIELNGGACRGFGGVIDVKYADSLAEITCTRLATITVPTRITG